MHRPKRRARRPANVRQIAMFDDAEHLAVTIPETDERPPAAAALSGEQQPLIDDDPNPPAAAARKESSSSETRAIGSAIYQEQTA